jgi:hypothetical protein
MFVFSTLIRMLLLFYLCPHVLNFPEPLFKFPFSTKSSLLVPARSGKSKSRIRASWPSKLWPCMLRKRSISRLIRRLYRSRPLYPTSTGLFVGLTRIPWAICPLSRLTRPTSPPGESTPLSGTNITTPTPMAFYGPMKSNSSTIWFGFKKTHLLGLN